MADLIERQAVLDTLNTYWKNEVDKIPKETGFEKLASMCDTILKYSNAIAKLIKHLSSAQPEPQWIPCSERLPERKLGTYLVTDKDGDVFVSGYVAPAKKWTSNGVLAWMPLPEPYEEDEHETD